MAPAQKLYPRVTVKRMVKAHSGKKVVGDVDILVFLDYTLFLHTLLRDATVHATKSGARSFTAINVKKVTDDALRKFKG